MFTGHDLENSQPKPCQTVAFVVVSLCCVIISGVMSKSFWGSEQNPHYHQVAQCRGSGASSKVGEGHQQKGHFLEKGAPTLKKTYTIFRHWYVPQHRHDCDYTARDDINICFSLDVVLLKQHTLHLGVMV